MGTISSVQKKGAPKRTASEMDPTTPVQRELVAAWVTDEVVEELQRRQLFAFANTCKTRGITGLDLFSLESHDLLEMGLPRGELYAFERMRRLSLNMPEVERMRGLIFADSPESCAFPGTAFAETGAKELVELPQGHGIKAGDRIRLQLEEEEDAGGTEDGTVPTSTAEDIGEADVDDDRVGKSQLSQRGQVVTACAPVGPTSIGIRPHRRGRTGRVHVFRCLTEVTAMHKGLNECGISRLYPALAWLPCLHTINFAFNGLGDEAMPYLLRALQQNRSIVRVRLDGNVSEEPISSSWIGRLHIAAALNAMASGEKAVVLRDLEMDDNLLAYLCGCDAELELHQAEAERVKREAEALRREKELEEKALRDALHKRHHHSHEHRDLFGKIVVDDELSGKHRRRRKKKRQHGNGSGHGQTEGGSAEGRNVRDTSDANEDEHKHYHGDGSDNDHEPLFDEEFKDELGASSKHDEVDVPPPPGVGDFLIPSWTAVGVTLPTNRSLTSLNLCYNEITDTGIRRIAAALKSNEALKSLNLGHNSFTDTGMADLCAALQSNHSLTELCVSGNSLTHHSDHSIRKLLRKNNTLTRIDLGATNVKAGVMADANAKVAANAARSNEHQQLRLRGLNDAGMGAVAEAMRVNHTVTHIDMCYNPKLTDVGGAKLLEVLSQNSIVTRIDAHTGNDLLHPELIDLLVARAQKNATAFNEAHRPV